MGAAASEWRYIDVARIPVPNCDDGVRMYDIDRGRAQKRSGLDDSGLVAVIKPRMHERVIGTVHTTQPIVGTHLPSYHHTIITDRLARGTRNVARFRERKGNGGGMR